MTWRLAPVPHTATFLRALGPGAVARRLRAAVASQDRWPLRRNPNRLQHYYQYQVVLKPSPPNILELYLGSLTALGFNLQENDVRFVEDVGRT